MQNLLLTIWFAPSISCAGYRVSLKSEAMLYTVHTHAMHGQTMLGVFFLSHENGRTKIDDVSIQIYAANDIACTFLRCVV